MIKESLEEKELQWSKDVVSKIQKIIVHALEMDEFHDASLWLAWVWIMLTPSNDSYTTKLSALPIIEAFLEFKKENISSQEQNRN